jgi:RecA-family ATPase
MTELGVKLVVVDNLGLASGGTDENSNKMANVMSGWRRLADDHKLAVMLIHHQTKGYSKSSGSRTGDSLRGHSSIEASIDLGLLAERNGQSEAVNIMPTKVRGADVPRFAATFTYSHKPGTFELDEARFFGAMSTYAQDIQAIEDAIIHTVSANTGINKENLAKAVCKQIKKAGINKIRAVIAQLEQAETLTVEKGRHGAKNYFLPEQNDASEDECLSDLQPMENSA